MVMNRKFKSGMRSAFCDYHADLVCKHVASGKTADTFARAAAASQSAYHIELTNAFVVPSAPPPPVSAHSPIHARVPFGADLRTVATAGAS